MTIEQILAEEFNLKEDQVIKTVELIDEGNTIPFISRYRKEVTGGLDDATLRDLNDRLNYLRNMEERRETISSLIEAQGKLTPEITFALNNAKTLVELEDIYLPYRPKRKTRASVARDKGLEPLAAYIMEQRDAYDPEIALYAEQFIVISDEKDKSVPDAQAALAGASDIIAEDISNTAEYGDYEIGGRIITEETKKSMKKILKDIQDGTFAKDFLLDMSSAGSQVHFNAMRKIAAEHPLEVVGADIRKLYSWNDEEKLINN